MWRWNRWAFRTFGFGGGREDVWEPDLDVGWGAETEWLGDDKRFQGERELLSSLGATHMGLIYVNPEGPNASGDYMAAAKDIRATFGRMAMDDEETVALIAGGHTFGKAHGAAPESHKGPEPEGCSIEAQGLGWTSSYGSGHGKDCISSGLEVTWTKTPTLWSNNFFENLFKFEWELTESPAGAKQWVAKDAPEIIPDAHVPGKFHKPTMLTTDLTLRFDPEFGKISRRFVDDPQAFAEAFARAWYKLTHRDMGPKARYLGPEVPKEDLIWQDPLPAATHHPSAADIADLKAQDRRVRTVGRRRWCRWPGPRPRPSAAATSAAAPTARAWPWPRRRTGRSTRSRVKALPTLAEIQKVSGKASLADVIVLAGSVGVEQAAKAAGVAVEVPFAPGRVDATQEQTDVESFSVLEPLADGFRNYKKGRIDATTEALLVDKAQLLTLTAPEMTALVGGLRVLGTNADGSRHGVFTDQGRRAEQ